jgi:competence protein ComEC
MKFIKFLLLFLLILAFLTTSAIFNRSDDKLHVYFLNVGQGDAIFIRGPKGQKILIDDGPDNSVLSELGSRMNFYDRKIDLLILTHPDSDHLIGLIDVLKRYKVGKILTNGLSEKSPEYQEWKLQIEENKIPVQLAKKGQAIEIEPNIKINILNPSHYLINQQIENTNNSSIVLKIVNKNVSFLLTGDAEEEVGDEFFKNNVDIKADILKISHHGSRNGLGNREGIIDKIKPELAIISVGKNKFGHPDQSILKLLDKYKINKLRTDEKGTIEIVTDGQGYKIE